MAILRFNTRDDGGTQKAASGTRVTLRNVVQQARPKPRPGLPKSGDGGSAKDERNQNWGPKKDRAPAPAPKPKPRATAAPQSTSLTPAGFDSSGSPLLQINPSKEIQDTQRLFKAIGDKIAKEPTSNRSTEESRWSTELYGSPGDATQNARDEWTNQFSTYTGVDDSVARAVLDEVPPAPRRPSDTPFEPTIPESMRYDPESRRRQLNPNFRQLTWDDFNAMDAAGQAAVRANTILQQAFERDRALIALLDTNGDGRISQAEGTRHFEEEGGRDSGLTQGMGNSSMQSYQAGYERVFGDRNEDTYAPNTLAALNLLGIEDSEHSLGSYAAGNAFISPEDVKAGAHTGGDARLTQITSNMQGLQDILETGRAVLDGFTQGTMAGAGADQLGQMVDSIRKDFAAGANFDALTDGNTGALRPDLSMFGDDTLGARQADLSTLYQQMTQAGITAEQMSDPEWLGENIEEIVLETGDFDISEWQRFLQLIDRASRADTSGDSATYTSTANTEEE